MIFIDFFYLFFFKRKQNPRKTGIILEKLAHCVNLRIFIESISEANFVIIGTILEISSLKDPCSETCMPMLRALMENFQNILNAHTKENVKISDKLENLMLLSGRKKHISSREGMEVENEKIKLNFDAPSNRFYSMKKD